MGDKSATVAGHDNCPATNDPKKIYLPTWFMKHPWEDELCFKRLNFLKGDTKKAGKCLEKGLLVFEKDGNKFSGDYWDISKGSGSYWQWLYVLRP